MRSPCETPWEIFTVPRLALGRAVGTEATRPLKFLSFGDAIASGLGSWGAASSPCAGVFPGALYDFTTIAGPVFFVNTSGSALMVVKGEGVMLADGLLF